MDNYIDRSASRRVSPQEMMRANAAAEAQENERLRLQREQYRKEVATYRKNAELTQSSLQNIEDMLRRRQPENNSEEILDALKALEEKLGKRSDASDEASHEVGVRIYRNVEAKLDEITRKQTEDLTSIIREGNTDELAGKVSLGTDVMTTQVRDTGKEVFARIDESSARIIEELEAKNEYMNQALEETKLAASQSERVLRPVILLTLILSIVNLAISLLQVFGIF